MTCFRWLTKGFTKGCIPFPAGQSAAMQTFGKRQYGHMELDPWARKKTSRGETAREPAIPSGRITAYMIALAAIGVIAFAGFEILVLA